MKKFKIEDYFFFFNLSQETRLWNFCKRSCISFPLLSLNMEKLCKTSKAFSTSISLISVPSNGVFRLLLDTNHRKTTLSSFFEVSVPQFFFLLDENSSALKYFSFVFTHVDIVFLGTPYVTATSLFEKLFSMSLRALHLSINIFTESFLLTFDMLTWLVCVCIVMVGNAVKKTSEKTFETFKLEKTFDNLN